MCNYGDVGEPVTTTLWGLPASFPLHVSLSHIARRWEAVPPSLQGLPSLSITHYAILYTLKYVGELGVLLESILTKYRLDFVFVVIFTIDYFHILTRNSFHF